MRPQNPRLQDIHQWLTMNEPDLVAQSLENERLRNSRSALRYQQARFGKDPEYRRMLGYRHRFVSWLVRRWAKGEAPTRNHQTGRREFGCTWEEMRAHVEAKWQEGMTWENYGKSRESWVLDHVRPICLFDWWKEEGLKQAFHWSNVQPLWWWQHRAKNERDLREARMKRRGCKELRERLQPEYAPDLEGTDEEIMARLAGELGITP